MRHIISVDTSGRIADIDGTPVDLTAKEFELLSHFARRPGRVTTKADALRVLWGEGSQQTVTRTVDAHISRLRRKFNAKEMLVNVWGVGWKTNPAYEWHVYDGWGAPSLNEETLHEIIAQLEQLTQMMRRVAC